MYNVGSNAFSEDLDFDEIDGISGQEVIKVVRFNDYADFDEIDGDNFEEDAIEDFEDDYDEGGYDSVWYIQLYDAIENLKNNISNKFQAFRVFLFKYIEGDFDTPVSDEDCEKEQIKLLKHKRKLEKLDNHEFWLRDHLTAVFETMLVIGLCIAIYILILGDDSVIIWSIKTLLKYR